MTRCVSSLHERAHGLTRDPPHPAVRQRPAAARAPSSGPGRSILPLERRRTCGTCSGVRGFSLPTTRELSLGAERAATAYFRTALWELPPIVRLERRNEREAVLPTWTRTVIRAADEAPSAGREDEAPLAALSRTRAPAEVHAGRSLGQPDEPRTRRELVDADPDRGPERARGLERKTEPPSDPCRIRGPAVGRRALPDDRRALPPSRSGRQHSECSANERGQERPSCPGCRSPVHLDPVRSSRERATDRPPSPLNLLFSGTTP